MVTFITGFPGSGKTYFEIYKIYKIMNQEHDLSNHIEIIYTNINGLKLDLFPNKGIELKKLNIDDFYKYLTESYAIYETYKNLDNVDEKLIEHSMQKGFYNCFIAFDECHDFLINQDKVKVYWLTYHRHLHHEIDLLTQNKSLIHSKYRAIPEIFIEAQPRSKKFFDKTLSYKHYASFAMRKSDLFNSSTLNSKKEIFELYTSGNTSKQKSIFKKFLLIMLFSFLILMIFILFIYNKFSTNKDDNESKNISNSEVVKKPSIPNNINNEVIKNKIVDNNDFVLKIEYYSNKGFKVYDNYYSINHFNKFLSSTNSKVLSKNNIIKNSKFNYSFLYISTTENKLSLFFVIPVPDDVELKKETNVLEKINL